MARRDEFETALAQARGDWRPTDYSQRILIPDARIAIASDVHIPYHDEKLLARFLRRCEEYQIESIVWLGDLVDHHTFSSWGRTDYSVNYPTEMRLARSVIELAAGVVQTQYWSRGNHEERLFRKTDNQIGMEGLANLFGLGSMVDNGLLITSDNPSLDAFPTRRGQPTWMLTHPAKYGSQPLVVPGNLAMRYDQHIMSAHAHHWGMGIDPTGKHTVIETGGLFDARYHEYVQYRVTGHRAWAQGFWFLLDGHPMGFRGGDD